MPSTTTTSASDSSQRITLPVLPELLNPNFLDTLLPPSQDEIARRAKDDGFTLFEFDDDETATDAETLVQPPVSSTTTTTSDAKDENQLISLLRATSESTPSSTNNLARTQNHARALKSTLSATLDAFSQLGGFTKWTDVEKLLDKAWKEDQEITLRIIWNLRSIVDGMGERETFYQAFGWLYKNHPRTAIANIHLLVEPVCERAERARKSSDKKTGDAMDTSADDSTKEQELQTTINLPHGYWKDLLNILALASLDQLSGNVKEAEFLDAPKGKKIKGKGLNKESKEEAKEARKTKWEGWHNTLLTNLETSKKFKALYVAVARLFATRLVEDLKLGEQVKALEKEREGVDKETEEDKYTALTDKIVALSKKISFAGKWAPTPACAHDKVTNIATAISFIIYQSGYFAPGSYPSSLPSPTDSTTSVESIIKDPAQCAVLRSFYQRWVLTPLREVSRIPEPLMCANKWSSIAYHQVPSRAMSLHTKTFFKHNQEGFLAYLKKVEKGLRNISGATLYPHELVAKVQMYGSQAAKKDKKKPQAAALAEAKLRVVEAQWKTLVESLKSAGTLDNCLSVCDVSGSMGSLEGVSDSKELRDSPQPIVVAVALSLIVASIAKPPFNGIITFSHDPAYVPLDVGEDSKSTLYQTVTKIIQAPWGYNTDFLKVFKDLLLPLAISNSLPQDQMIKRLFVFSDMQFDEAASTAADYYSSQNARNQAEAAWNTTYDLVEKAYKEAGYEVPKIVFWNLAGKSGGHQTVEVTADRKGVAMMTGFSPALLKVFMEKKDITPGDWDMVSAEEVECSDLDDKEKAAKEKEKEKAEKEKDTPLGTMKETVTRKSYSALRVFD